MRILEGLITALRDIVADVKEHIGEIKDRIDERRNETLAERLDKKANGRNWRESIIDLLDTVGMDSSRGARRLLAIELGYKGEYTGTEEQNIWLHGEVLKRLAAPPHFICLPARTK